MAAFLIFYTIVAYMFFNFSSFHFLSVFFNKSYISVFILIFQTLAACIHYNDNHETMEWEDDIIAYLSVFDLVTKQIALLDTK